MSVYVTVAADFARTLLDLAVTQRVAEKNVSGAFYDVPLAPFDSRTSV